MKVAIRPVNWYSRYNHQMISTISGGQGNKGTGGDCPNFSNIKIGQNTEKSPGHLRRLTVTQTPVENYQLTLMLKISRSKIIVTETSRYKNDVIFR